jgi:hypothetical protein
MDGSGFASAAIAWYTDMAMMVYWKSCTKATPAVDAAMEQAIRELDAGEYVTDSAIYWD